MEVRMELFSQEVNRIVNSKLPWSKLSGKTILLSGATGMVGKCLIDVLMLRNRVLPKNDKMKVIAISRNADSAALRLDKYLSDPDFRYFACDINTSIPECGQVDYVIHAASNTHPMQYSLDPIGTIASNVIGTKNLLDYAVSHGAKHFCFLSSVEIYGENRGDMEKFPEGYQGYLDCNTLRAGYPESKRLGETLCHAYGQTFGLDFCIPRLSRLYGPTMLLSDSKAISQFIKKAAAGEDIILKSEGTQKYSYTFVTDALAGILHAMLLGESGEAYNIANAESDITLKELAELLAHIGGTRVVFELPDEAERKGYSTATKAMLDASKLMALGWEPHVDMQAGLACTVGAVKSMLVSQV